MKRKIIIVVLVLLCFVSIILGVYFIVHNNSSDKYTLESIRYEYLNSDRKVVAAVNDGPPMRCISSRGTMPHCSKRASSEGDDLMSRRTSS